MSAITEPASFRKLVTVTTEVREHHIGFLVAGIVIVTLGIAAITFPFLATQAVKLLIGWILAVSGVVGIVQALRIARWNGFLFFLLGAVLSLGIGIIVLLSPLTGMLSLTPLIAAYFLASSTFRILLALRLRPLDHWTWLLVSGILALVLAVLILLQWPEAATRVIGILVGIDLIFAGWISIMLSLAARRSA